MSVAAPIGSFIQLTRPVFLLGGALLYALGAAIVHTAGARIDGGRYALGQLMVTSIQAMTHYANEYFDREPDRLVGSNRTWFSGGSGALVAGRLSPQVALRAARACGAVALVAISVTAAISPAASLIGAGALLGGWFYSAPPIRTSARGFGELGTAAIVSFLVPSTAALIQGRAIDSTLIAIALPLALINLAMQLSFELPDLDADRATGKWTLAVRLGSPRAARLHDGLLAAAFITALLFSVSGWVEPRILAWLIIALPLALWQIIFLHRAALRRRGYPLLTAGGVGLFALSALLALAGVLAG